MAFDSKAFMDRVQSVDWKRLASYANPQAVKDLDSFLDNLPVRVGSKALYIAISMWVLAAVFLLVAYTKSVNLQEVRREITQAEALRPSVPVVAYKPVPDGEIVRQVEKMKDVYKTLTIKQSNGVVDIAANSTRDFPVWRAAMGDLSAEVPGEYKQKCFVLVANVRDNRCKQVCLSSSWIFQYRL